MNKLEEYFNHLDNISHAFLIGNVIFDEIEESLIKIIDSKILPGIKNIKENPDIFYYDQYSELITKEEIKQLLNNISKTSQFNNVKIYIINGAERLSDTVYNALLKTLEEPQLNVYAFLLSNNIENVRETIKSRCQKIFINSSVDRKIENEELRNTSLKIINNIESNGINTMFEYNNIYSEIEDREKFKEILYILLKEYDLVLRKKLNNEKYDSIIIEKNDIISLSKKVLVIDKTINNLNNYLNKNLAIDRFLIEMWRCKNEMC